MIIMMIIMIIFIVLILIEMYRIERLIFNFDYSEMHKLATDGLQIYSIDIDYNNIAVSDI